MGFQKLQNKLAATAKYYGAGRPVSKLTGACGARIIDLSLNGAGNFNLILRGEDAPAKVV
jgi:hypothetical protein